MMEKGSLSVGKNWYVIHTYSGYETKVKESIEERAKSSGMQEKISRVLIPTEEVVELRQGKKRTTSRKFFPGYVLIEMEMSDDTWHLVKTTPKVTGFIGGKEKPTPLSEEEVGIILKQIETGIAVPKSKVQFQKGDNVRISDGPFLGFVGIVDEVDSERGKVKVMVSIFGRSTPVELDFLQLERL